MKTTADLAYLVALSSSAAWLVVLSLYRARGSTRAWVRIALTALFVGSVFLGVLFVGLSQDRGGLSVVLKLLGLAVFPTIGAFGAAFAIRAMRRGSHNA